MSNLSKAMRNCIKASGQMGPGPSQHSTDIDTPCPAALQYYSVAGHCALIALQCAKFAQPFNMITDDEYVYEVLMLRPHTIIPDPSTILRDIKHIYAQMSIHVKSYFSVSNFRFAFDYKHSMIYRNLIVWGGFVAKIIARHDYTAGAHKLIGERKEIPRDEGLGEELDREIIMSIETEFENTILHPCLPLPPGLPIPNFHCSTQHQNLYIHSNEYLNCFPAVFRQKDLQLREIQYFSVVMLKGTIQVRV
jgi:hypothetical protein